MIVLAFLLALTAAAQSPRPQPDALPLDRVQTQFVLRCGGCHGVEGRSPPANVPQLRGTATYFLCTAAGRDYAARLPNVAQSPLSDRELAEVMNYVMFNLADGKTPAASRPYTAEEIGALRRRPLTGAELGARRTRTVLDLIRTCGAPKELLRYGRH
jgi:mono/diheme cytochrome c family protein